MYNKLSIDSTYKTLWILSVSRVWTSFKTLVVVIVWSCTPLTPSPHPHPRPASPKYKLIPNLGSWFQQAVRRSKTLIYSNFLICSSPYSVTTAVITQTQLLTGVNWPLPHFVYNIFTFVSRVNWNEGKQVNGKGIVGMNGKLSAL